LSEIGNILQEKLTGKNCKAMQGLIEEAKEILDEESQNEAVLDALLIGAAQRVEHYEMAGYGTACAMARALGEDDVANLLEETLEEEKSADQRLTEISEDEVLVAAAKDLEEEGEDEDLEEEEPKKKIVPQRNKKTGNVGRNLALIGGMLAITQISTPSWAESKQSVQQVKNEKAAGQYSPDNTGKNVRDRDDSRVTADDQTQGQQEVELLAKIRSEIVANKDLSGYGKNVKIIVEKNSVFLRGPVRSITEKNWIGKTAEKAAPNYRVVNELEIAAD
jgi:hypothetical protein